MGKPKVTQIHNLQGLPVPVQPKHRVTGASPKVSQFLIPIPRSLLTS